MVLTILTPDPAAAQINAAIYGVDVEVTEVDGDRAFVEFSGDGKHCFLAALGLRAKVIDFTRTVRRTVEDMGATANYASATFR